jgi:hypothetical protein
MGKAVLHQQVNTQETYIDLFGFQEFTFYKVGMGGNWWGRRWWWRGEVRSLESFKVRGYESFLSVQAMKDSIFTKKKLEIIKG